MYAAAILGVTLTYASAGVVAAQIMPTRSAAVGVTVGVLFVGLLPRMLADGVPAVPWSAWATPFGLSALAAPYAENRVAPLLVLAGASVCLAGAALVAARRRDVGNGLVTVTASRAPRILLLGSIGGFATQRAVRSIIGWATSIAAYFLLVGALIASILEFMDRIRVSPNSPQRRCRRSRFGERVRRGAFQRAADSHRPVRRDPAGHHGRRREEHAAGRPCSPHPISRTRLIFTEIAVSTAGVIVLHATAASRSGPARRSPAHRWDKRSFGRRVEHRADRVARAGRRRLALGWLPSAVGAIGALPVAGGFLLNVVAQSTHAPGWLVNLSPFAHLSAVPNTPPDWARSLC